MPVSAAVLPGHRLLTFAAYDAMNFNKGGTVTKVSTIDLATGRAGQTLTVDTHHEMFCTGLAMLADGRLLVNGGSSDSATTIYDPATGTWIRGPLMNIPRAYEGDTPLSTGQVFTLGGSWYDSAGQKDGELFTPAGTTGSWSRLPGVTADPILTADPAGVYRADNHAWLFGWTGGTVFHAGPSRQMHWITTTGNGTIASAGPAVGQPGRHERQRRHVRRRQDPHARRGHRLPGRAAGGAEHPGDETRLRRRHHGGTRWHR